VTSCLSFHASYRCRHAGACCAAPWQVRADDQALAFVSSSPKYAGRGRSLFVNQPARAGQAPQLSIAKGNDGVCVFREDRRCVIHAAAGEGALPIGCRHYPRVVRIERERIALSLSHYCPTAASLLVSETPIRLVDAPPPLVLSEPIEGLDAREALPPLLRPGLLMDLEAYTAWETAVVTEFSTCRRADIALRRIGNATDRLREWRPGTSALGSAVAGAFAHADASELSWMEQGLPIARRLNRGVVSLDLIADREERTPKSDERSAKSDERTAKSETQTTDAIERIVANYLAARVYGNWIAYQGRGLRTIVTWLFACHDSVRLLMRRGPAEGVPGAIEAIRQADYVMLHTIDTQEFADAAREVDG
jgi:hypothetical protein